MPRLSDPFFASRPLGAPDAEPGRSLVFGTISVEPGALGPGHVADVVLRRVRPDEEVERIATARLPFRAFRTRQVRDGHFVLALEPGAYEVARIVGDGWGSPVLAPSEDARRATRFTVTRPGVVDLGVVRFARDGFGTYTMTLHAPPADPARAAVLRAVVAGTPWERLHTSEVAR